MGLRSTHNESHVNDVNGCTFLSEASSGKEGLQDSQALIPQNP